MKATGKRTGRPTKPAVPGKRATLGAMVSPEIKQRVHEAAQRAGRTLSQEMEMRLEQSFAREDLLSDALTLAYGPTLKAAILSIARAMRDASYAAAFAESVSRGTLMDNADIAGSPFRYDQAVEAAKIMLEERRPKGAIVCPPIPDIGLSSAEIAALQNPAIAATNTLRAALAGKGATAELRSWADSINQQLGKPS